MSYSIVIHSKLGVAEDNTVSYADWGLRLIAGPQVVSIKSFAKNALENTGAKQEDLFAVELTNISKILRIKRQAQCCTNIPRNITIARNSKWISLSSHVASESRRPG